MAARVESDVVGSELDLEPVIESPVDGPEDVRPPTRHKRNWVVNGALILAIAVAAGFAVIALRGSGSSAVSQRDVTVTRGNVTSTVSATGTVEPPASLSLTVPSGGLVTAVHTQVGSVVHAGDVLVETDTLSAAEKVRSSQASVNQAKANLAKAQAALQDLLNGPTAATFAKDAAGLAQSQTQVNAAQSALDQTKAVAGTNATQYQTAVDQAQASYDSALSVASGDTTAAPVVTAANQLTDAKNAQTSGLTKDQQTITSAQNSLASALASYNSTAAANALAEQQATPAKVAQSRADVSGAQANVESAQASLVTAQDALDKTRIVAPVEGTVTAVNAVVGQDSSSGGGSASSSSSGTSGASSSGSSSSGSSGSGSSSSGLVTLSTAGFPHVVASFSEVDAAKLKVDQEVTVTFDSLPNVSVTGRVSQIAQTSTTSNNVITYSTTIALESQPDGVKSGMSANAQVTVDSKSDVLEVPSVAVTNAGRRSTVQKVVKGKNQTTVVEVGLKGDTATEVTSGLSQGDVVAIVTSRSTGTGTGGSTPGTGRITTGGGGIGGGGIGGAGIGAGGGRLGG